MKYSFLGLAIMLLLFSCRFGSLSSTTAQLEEKNQRIIQLESQIEHFQHSNTSLLDRLHDMSVVNRSEAESIRNSLESLNRQNEYIQMLGMKIHEKDSIHLALISNLKRSLTDFDDEDIAIEVRGASVHISISDQLLFSTASSRVSTRAYPVLQKVSGILNDHHKLDILVLGHTDSVPISNARYTDNWDLSVLRATSVVRILHQEFDIDPTRLTAGGKSFYSSKSDNTSFAGRRVNRRTEIVLTPKLDQFFKLLEMPELMG